jgi:hypothetical protein
VVSEEIHYGIVRHGYVDVGPYVRSVRVCVAKRYRRGWVHFPAPVPGERVLPASGAKPPLRVPALVVAAPTRTSEGAAADELTLVSGTAGH